MQKKSVFLLISGIIGAIYSVYLVTYFAGASGDAAGAIATVLVMPHMVLSALGTVFALAGYFAVKRGFALASIILFIVGAVIFPIYALFLVPSIVLAIIGYAKMKNKGGEINEEE